MDQYARFIEDVVELVVKKYDGALKAEHGTGRNMAPFVETEWGPEAYAVMKRLKELCDPEGILNPGVLLNADPMAHLKDLKPMPTVEEEVDKCIECGYCEPKCPSRELTLTPRQRIVLRREMTRLETEGGNAPLLAALEADFPYAAVDTCAVDGLCATACPVSIDTGQLTKRLRKAQPLRAGEEGRPRPRPPLRDDRAGDADGPARRAPRPVRSSAPARWPASPGRSGPSSGSPSRSGAPRCRTPRRRRARPRRRKGRPPSTSRPASRGRWAPCPGEPDETSLMEAFVAVAKRAGVAGLDPGRRRGDLLRRPLLVEGLCRRERLHREPGDRALLGLVGRRAGSRSSSTRAPAPTA